MELAAIRLDVGRDFTVIRFAIRIEPRKDVASFAVIKWSAAAVKPLWPPPRPTAMRLDLGKTEVAMNFTYYVV